MSPWKVILATMVIFVCGVVTGALLIKSQEPASPQGHPGPPVPPGMAQVRDIMRQMTQAHMDLSTNQYVKIAKILQDEQATNYAQLQREVERAHQAIDQLLTPEQRTIYAELRKKPEARPDSRGRRGGEGGMFQPRNTNRAQTNGPPADGRGRRDRGGSTNNVSTNKVIATLSNNVPTNSLSTTSLSTNGP